MTVRIGMRAVAALILLLAAAPLLAHEGHEKKAEQRPAAEASQPEPSAEPSEEIGHLDDGIQRPTAPARPQSRNQVLAPLAWLGKLHPAVTHFPIALLTAAAVAELLYLRTRNLLFRHASDFSIWGGAIGALIAAPLGWLFGGVRLFDDEWVMTAHRWAGTGTAVWAASLLYLLARLDGAAAPAVARARLRVALLIGVPLLGATGFLGGALIYGLDHYAWQVSG